MESPWENDRFAFESLNHVDNKFLNGTNQEVDYMERKLNLVKGDKLLDLGCGAGRHSIEMALRGYHIDAVDISETMLLAARHRATQAGVKINFKQMNLAKLNIHYTAEGLFKGAICICESGLGVLGGADEDLQFIKSVFRLLVPGGRFILTSFNGLRRYIRSLDNNRNFDYIDGVVHWSRKFDDQEILEEKQRLYIPSEIKMLFKFAGFKEVELYGCAPGNFQEQRLKIDDIELMVVGTKP